MRFTEYLCRCIGLFWLQKTRRTFEIENDTPDKFFILKEPGDFVNKKAIPIEPHKKIDLYVSIFHREITFRIADRDVLVFAVSLFQFKTRIIITKKADGGYDIEYY